MDIGDPRLVDYAAKYGGTFEKKLGFGREGDVFAIDRPSAVKFFHDHRAYDRELEVYQALKDLTIETISGHAVPKLIRHDADFRAIEMSIVTPPFLLDFAGAKTELEAAYLDFAESQIEEHPARLIDLYANRWHEVLAIADAFTRATGYVLMDIKPGNITF